MNTLNPNLNAYELYDELIKTSNDYSYLEEKYIQLQMTYLDMLDELMKLKNALREE